MTIHNKEAFVEGLWDWAVLDGCFGATKIRPTDVDGLIERHGCFLFLEAKPCGGTLTQGQSITFHALSRQPRTWVIVLYGDPQAQRVVRITRFANGKMQDETNPSLDRLRAMVLHWYEWAEAQPSGR